MYVKLRSDSKIEDVGSESQVLLGGRLPLVRDVFTFFFYHHRTLRQTIRQSARTAVRETVQKFWSKTRIPIVQEIRSIEKIEQLHAEWKALSKSKNRAQDKQIDKFTSKLDCLFDIAVKDAIPKMQNALERETNPAMKAALAEDIAFLEDQRNSGSRKGTIAGIDGNLTRTEKRKSEKLARKISREKALNERREKDLAKIMPGIPEENIQLDEMLEQDNVEHDAEEDVRRINRGSKKIISPELAQALDAAKVSNSQATVILAAAAKCLGVNIEETNVNVTSVRRNRDKARDSVASKIKEEFQADDVLTVHWDGKIVSTLTGKDHVDRQAIIVTGIATTQLLGAPALERGTGKAIAESVVHHLKMWDITANVKAMSFDTTAANTGCKNGAATWIENMLGKNLLWLPCRHHILEIVLEAVYHAIMGPSTGPEIEIFERFQKKWKDINHSSYNVPENYPPILDSSRRAVIIMFAETQINVGQPRDDYLELLELTIIFLGGTPPKGIRFRQPGPMHSARWMSKAIYSFKVWLFRSQFQLRKEDAAGLLNVCFFVVSAYIEAWYSAPFSVSAPRSDLQLVAKLQDFTSVHPQAASIAQKKMAAHLWYLSEKLIGLAVFDEGLADAEREALIYSIRNKVGSEDPPKKRDIHLTELVTITIPDLGTTSTAGFFDTLDIATDFFDLPASTWPSSNSYQRGKQAVDNLRVVNDHAERAVKLVQDYNRSLTQKEEGFQNLLLNVSEHRKSLPDVKKSTIVKKYSI